MVACSQAQVIWVRPFNVPCPASCGLCNGTFTCPVATIQDALGLLPWGGTVRLFSVTYAINDPALTAGAFTILYVMIDELVKLTLRICSGNGTATIVTCAGTPGFRVFNGNAQFTNFVITNCIRYDSHSACDCTHLTYSNRSGGNGGAFNVQGAFAGFSGILLLANAAARGGGIYVENGSVDIVNGSELVGKHRDDHRRRHVSHLGQCESWSRRPGPLQRSERYQMCRRVIQRRNHRDELVPPMVFVGPCSGGVKMCSFPDVSFIRWCFIVRWIPPSHAIASGLINLEAELECLNEDVAAWRAQRASNSKFGENKLREFEEGDGFCSGGARIRVRVQGIDEEVRQLAILRQKGKRRFPLTTFLDNHICSFAESTLSMEFHLVLPFSTLSIGVWIRLGLFLLPCCGVSLDRGRSISR
jgi:hypothetical protein